MALWCCGKGSVAAAGVLDVRAEGVVHPRAPPESWKNCCSPAVPPRGAAPKSGKTVSHQPCPPQIWEKLFFTDPRGDDGDGDDGDGVTCDQQIPRFARTIGS